MVANVTTQWSAMAELQNRRYKETCEHYGVNLDAKTYATLSTADADEWLQVYENDLEGNSAFGDGIDGNLLSWDKFIVNEDDPGSIIFQNESGTIFTNINFGQGYAVMMNEQAFGQSMGMNYSNGRPYDYINFGQNTASFVDVVFSGYLDGSQDAFNIDLGAAGNVPNYNIFFTRQEFALGAATGNIFTNNVEEQKANLTMQEIVANEAQWLTNEDKEFLSQFKVGSSQYDYYYKLLAFEAFNQEADVYWANL